VTGHTPGPWHVEKMPSDAASEYITGHITSPLHTYCGNTVGRTDSITDASSMTWADAHLIAAAPDLLDAVKLAYQYAPFHTADCEGITRDEYEGGVFENRDGCTCFIAKMLAAIAKAEGREP